MWAHYTAMVTNLILWININNIYLSSHGNQVDNQTWFGATLVYRFNECNRRSYNS